MNKKWILLFMTGLLALVTAACGSNSASPAPAQTTAASTDAAKAPEAASEEVTIKHKLGEAKLKKNPQTVV
ncbi:MAG: transporter substrate binding protein, partial [Brevibacillus sp.]|nr:transporter substrate binding protein [Brevibacillus sp.]